MSMNYKCPDCGHGINFNHQGCKMTNETELMPCPFDAAMWKGEPSGNPEKGWITNSRGVRLTRLGSRHFFGKLISDHNKEIEFLKNKISSADLAVPEGHAIVPLEPTRKMCAAGRSANAGPIFSRPFYIYKAMIAAAQKGGE